MVNATAPNSTNDATIYWVLLRPRLLEKRDGTYRFLLDFIVDVFSRNSQILGYQFNLNEGSSNFEESTLMSCDGLELRVGRDPMMNVVNPEHIEAAGEIKSHDGHKLLLMMIQLQTEFAKLPWATDLDPLVEFSDKAGKSISFNRSNASSSIAAAAELLGFDLEEVLGDAVLIGLVHEDVQWSSLTGDIDNSFF